MQEAFSVSWYHNISRSHVRLFILTQTQMWRQLLPFLCLKKLLSHICASSSIEQFLLRSRLLTLLQITRWRHQMEIFSVLLAICAGSSPVTDDFPTQRPVTRSFDVFSDLCLVNGWVNNHETCDLRSHRAHYNVTVTTTFPAMSEKLWFHNCCCVVLLWCQQINWS